MVLHLHICIFVNPITHLNNIEWWIYVVYSCNEPSYHVIVIPDGCTFCSHEWTLYILFGAQRFKSNYHKYIYMCVCVSVFPRH